MEFSSLRSSSSASRRSVSTSSHERSPSSSRATTPELVPGQVESLIRSKIAKVLNSGEHPLSQLYSLHQIGAVRVVVVRDLGCQGTVSTFRVGVGIVNEKPTFESIVARGSKKAAKHQAASNVLEAVSEILTYDPPKQLRPCTLPRPQNGAHTPNQLRMIEEDRVHGNLVRHLASLRGIRGHRVGILSIDLEQYEHDLSITLEVGVSFVRLSHCWCTDGTVSRHMIVEDQTHLANGKYCSNNRDNFMFGASERVLGADLATATQQIVRELTTDCDTIYLVGHSVHSDLKWLKELGVNLEWMEVVDVGRAYRAIQSHSNDIDMIGMEKILAILQIEAPYLHNGGNDARYNIEVLKKLWQMEEPMCNGEWGL